MMGNAGHGGLLALRQSNPEQARANFGILKKHLIKVAEPKKQEGIRRQAAFDLEILLHHGR